VYDQSVKNHKRIQRILKSGYDILPTSQKLHPRNFVKEEDVHGKDQSNDQSRIQ